MLHMLRVFVLLFLVFSLLTWILCSVVTLVLYHDLILNFSCLWTIDCCVLQVKIFVKKWGPGLNTWEVPFKPPTDSTETLA